MTRRPLLIVNADDYGLTEGVSRAILQAHLAGVVTSTSVIALAPGFERTAAWLRDAPGLGTGAHLALVGEDPPLLSPSEIPSLVDRHGRLHLSWRTFLPAAAAGRIDPADVRREFSAQLDRLVAAGITPDHLDSHQNVHLWPMVRNEMMRLGEERGIRAIRVTRSSARGPVGAVVRRLAGSLERTCDARGWSYAGASTGLDEAGGLDTGGMVAAIARLAADGASAAELATHPGEPGDAALTRYRWGYRWAEEFEALRSPSVRRAVEWHGFRLGRFADIPATRTGIPGTRTGIPGTPNRGGDGSG